MRFIICTLVSAHADAAYIIHSSRVCCRLISRFIIQSVNCVTFRKEGSGAMGLTKALLVLRSAGFPPLHQLFALVCLVFVIYKFITLVALRQKVLQDFETFIGPPGHWLFGHTFEVLSQGMTSTHSTQLLNREGKFIHSHFFFFAIKLISVQTRWGRLAQVSGIRKAIPVCLPAAVRPIHLFPDHSPPGLCENYSGFHRWVNTSPTQSDWWGPKEIDQNHHKYSFSPTAPKDDLTVSFIEPWIGETDSVGAACRTKCLLVAVVFVSNLTFFFAASR